MPVPCVLLTCSSSSLLVLRSFSQVPLAVFGIAAADPGGVLPSNRLMGMCRWIGSHFHDWIDYNGAAFSLGANRVTRMGSHICGFQG